MKKTKLILGTALATLTMTAVMVSPQAAAKESERHHADRMAQFDANKEKVLEAQLQAMQDEILSLRAAVNAAASAKTVDADTKKVQELDEWMVSVKNAPKPERNMTKDSMLYFRGGYTMNDEPMVATTSYNSTAGPTGSGAGSNGWNFGAGVDFNLHDDLFGLMKGAEVLGELDLNYVDLGTFNSSVLGSAQTPALLNFGKASTASQSMLRISTSPKIKFMKGSKFRPWVIPVGFTFNIISPPSQSNTITELKPGMNFGTGLDYNIWKSLYIGADVRYFLATTSLDGTNVNGLTAGGQLGFGF
jgi:opacity protein-like surface antigen